MSPAMLGAFILLATTFVAGVFLGYLACWARWRDPEVAKTIMQRLYAVAQKKWIRSDEKDRDHCPLCGWNPHRGQEAHLAVAHHDNERRGRRLA